jgi:hypothetical protein
VNARAYALVDSENGAEKLSPGPLTEVLTWVQAVAQSASLCEPPSTLVVAGAPADGHVAPPGYYLLVVLDANRTPSAARIVRLT